MTLYRAVLLIKFLAVMAYAGGLIASFVASSASERKLAVHRIASPALMAIWAAGYALASLTDVGLFELWIVGGLALSLVSNLALVASVSRDQRTAKAFAWCVAPLVLVLALMVFRPTWSAVLS